MAPPADATDHTRRVLSAAAERLDLTDTADVDDARRGFVAPLPDGGIVRNAEGRVVWDANRYAFADGGDAPDTVHPSLWRHTQVMNVAGLFEVTGGVYQVRSADLSNIDFIEGETGVIVVDPLVSAEPARMALDLYRARRPGRDVVAVIYTHSHIDHFGGVRGVVTDDQLAAGSVRIIAPVGFTEAALSENVIAGPAMGRRASYMYGMHLEPGPRGGMTSGLGLATSSGSVGFVAPTEEITEDIEEVTIDGVRFTFMLAPDTEAPAEMLFHLPDHRALCSAEDATHTLHNLYTPRGARTRDAKRWAHYIDQAILRFGGVSDVVFAQHHWPVWGADRVVDFLEGQRDAYKYLHDQTLRLANEGYTMLEIAEMLDVPNALGPAWHTRSYYGSVSHNVKAVYNFYLGYFDGNPAHLHPLPPEDAAARYVELMGGADAVVERARASFDAGEYRWVAQVLDHVVFADPTHTGARELAAAAMEQLAYQTENAVWRNFYLTGAKELRDGPPRSTAMAQAVGDIVSSIPVETLLDGMAVRLDGPRAAGLDLIVAFDLTDGARHVLRVRNGVLNHWQDRTDLDPQATLTMTSAALRRSLAGGEGFGPGIASGDIAIDGDAEVLLTLAGLFVQPAGAFPIVEP